MLIFDSHVPFVEAAEFKRSEVYVPGDVWLHGMGTYFGAR
jgi:hypothetical protein